MRGNHRELCFNQKEKYRVWKHCMERVMNEDNYLGLNAEEDAVEGPEGCVSRDEVITALQEMNAVEATGLSDALLKLTAASGYVGIQVMVELSRIV